MKASFSGTNIDSIIVFDKLDLAQKSIVDENIVWRNHSKDSIILNHHDSSTEVYFLAKGHVKATTYSASGKEIAYQDLYDGEMFGELSAIDDLNRISSVIAEENSIIGSMKADDFIQILNSYPQVNEKVMLRLTGLIRFLCGRIYENSALDVKDRVRAEIIRHARINKNPSNFSIIENMPTHEEIANKISTHREAVTKEISYLAKHNFIEKQGRKIIVNDINRLASLLAEEI